MPTYFPQINSNLIITQVPYASGFNFDTVSSDVETGMRWAYPRRMNTDLDEGPPHSGFYAPVALGRFALNYPNVTDDEAVTLKNFFDSMMGRYGSFSFLDPSGNLLGYSEEFGPDSPFWTLTNITLERSPYPTPSNGVRDPFSSSLRASTFQAAGADCYAEAPIGGPNAVGLYSLTQLSGLVMCFSIYAQALQVNQTLFIGFKDSVTLETRGVTKPLPLGQWVRLDYSTVMWTDNVFNVIIGGNGTFSNSIGDQEIQFFGAQVSPMKGPGAYIATPTLNGGGFGYHASVRFDTDEFARQIAGPNQNAIQLPCYEYNASGQALLVFADTFSSGGSTPHGTAINLMGWALSAGNHVVSVAVYVGGGLAGMATYSQSRPDVPFPSPDTPNVGFTFSYTPPSIGPSSWYVVATLDDGRTANSSTNTFTVT